MSDLRAIKRNQQNGSKKRSFIAATTIILVICLNQLGLEWKDFTPNENGYKALKRFILAAFSPATDYQSTGIPESAPPYSHKIIDSLWRTLQYATCAMSIAIPIGIILGFFCSKSWWPPARHSRSLHIIHRIIHRIARTIITFGRSIHELLWALLFITALGTSPFAAIMALAIPFGCTLAKVFSEIIDEQDTGNSNCLKAHGALSLSSWLFGMLPSALPDLISYALYRYECAIRSAAILGFVGIATTGYHIKTAFDDRFYNEFWTLLYSLLILLIIIEKISSYCRHKINTPPTTNKKTTSLKPITSNRLAKIKQLHKQAGKKNSLYIIAACLGILTIIAWNTGEPIFSKLSSEQRAINLDRFLTKEITPHPVRQSGDWLSSIPWATNLFLDKGLYATLQTLLIATSAIILAFFFGLISIPFATKSLNHATYKGVSLGLTKTKKRIRKVTSLLTKAILMLSRSMPEYLLAFILLGILGNTAWPLILGLAIHNFGIIGRLGGEILDNADPNNAKIAAAHGANSNQIYLFTLLPAVFNRLLLYFFYRWETCIREATIMGMLGISSLGFLIEDARARDKIDQMFFFILLGACLVMIGDIISDIVRNRLRKA